MISDTEYRALCACADCGHIWSPYPDQYDCPQCGSTGNTTDDEANRIASVTWHSSDLKTAGLKLASDHTPDQLLAICAWALEDWNIHDIAAQCRERITIVPDWLRAQENVK